MEREHRHLKTVLKNDRTREEKRMKRKILSVLLCLAVLGTGMLCSPLPGAAEEAAEPVVVDNADARHTSKNGTWNAGASKTGYYGDDYEANPGGQADAWFQWQPEITKAGWYHLYCMLPNVSTTDTSISNQASYTVTGSDGDKTVYVNQRKSGGNWEYMGTFRFEAGTSGRVVLKGTGNGTIIADALRFAYTDDSGTFVSDNTDSTTEFGGTWNDGWGKPGYYGTDYVSARADETGGTWAKWKTALAQSGYYRVSYSQPTVSADDTSVSNRAPYEIAHSTGTAVAYADQRRAAGWYELGTYLFPAGETEITLTAKGGSVIADAVKYEFIGQPNESGIEVDNDEAQVTGGWSASTWRAGYKGSDYLTTPPDDAGGKSVTWTPNIPEDGYYAVSCWYPEGNAQSCTDVPYTVTDAYGSTEYPVSQKENGMQWRLLGVHWFRKGTGGSVTLVNKGGGGGSAICADAVRFSPLTHEYDDAAFIGEGSWTRQENPGAVGGSYQVGENGATLSSENPVLVSTGGYYLLQYHRPAGTMPQGTAVVSLGAGKYTVDLGGLHEGYNTLASVPIKEGQAYGVSITAEGGTAWADALRLVYTGYDLAYLDYENGSRNEGWSNSDGSDWAVTGGALTGTAGSTSCTDTQWNSVELAVKLSAGNMRPDGSFGIILGGDGQKRSLLSYDAARKKFSVTDIDGKQLAESGEITLAPGRDYELTVSMNMPELSVSLDGGVILTGSLFRSGEIGFFTDGAALSVKHLFIKSGRGAALLSGSYQVDLNDPQQVIQGLGVEVQSDSIASGNSGLPEATTSAPHDLTQSERDRLYSDMLQGFRYLRLATGLYYRGTDAEGKHLRERWDTQNEELAELIEKSGIEGVDFEYWSPTPYFKSTGSYIGGTLKCFDPAFTGNRQDFLTDFANTVKEDIAYLDENGIPVIDFGLQNEPHVGGGGYSKCTYTNEQYYETMKAVIPVLKAAYPGLRIHADSNSGQYGRGGALIRQDPDLLALIDGWTFHRIGYDSNDQISNAAYYNSNKGRDDIAVYNNEFEYLDEYTSDVRCINTAQSIMNWMTFENSPTWYWLHMLKPLGNSEASGYSLGFWRAQGDDKVYDGPYNDLAQGEWDYNYQNWNSVRGFLKYMPWNSQRYTVHEDQVRGDQRIMAFKTPEGKLVIAVTNRSTDQYFRYNIDTGVDAGFKGYRYTPQGHDEISLEPQNGSSISPTLPPLSIEFWVQA